jgi:hypothetical protein
MHSTLKGITRGCCGSQISGNTLIRGGVENTLIRGGVLHAQYTEALVA